MSKRKTAEWTPPAPSNGESLADVLKADRIKRRLTWPAYAKFLNQPMSTVYKIAQGTHAPRELTEVDIRETLAANPVPVEKPKPKRGRRRT